ncbi:hypothetical protein FV228_07850 [Methylobacterium sp. WL18]|jgi:hypothetical protein|uniref:hypothetical protein n=1 Tax=unclassified Methylobacterium TaxID=2615210 RepID=UPI0011C808F9|nr:MULTISPECIES: hypothetical protein [unclassified Methylobacterium]TXN40413.1 hypothetical protein FV233_26740 [Methylobacterium sp. WL7]TXN73735.1 hypothetical protein FV228_07850 [Methylobacterium sp. WL18]
MKNLILACSFGTMLISGSAFAHESAAQIDPSLIVRTNGSGLDAWSSSEGNDKAGGMWEGATGYSAAVPQQPVYTGSVPSNRQWSHLNTRTYHRSAPSY